MKAGKCINVHVKTLRDYLRIFLRDMHQASLLCKQVTKSRSEQTISKKWKVLVRLKGRINQTRRVTLKGAVIVNEKSREPD